MAAMLVEAYIPDFSIEKVAHPAQVVRQVWSSLKIDLGIDVQTPEYFTFKLQDLRCSVGLERSLVLVKRWVKSPLAVNVRVGRHIQHAIISVRTSIALG